VRKAIASYPLISAVLTFLPGGCQQPMIVEAKDVKFYEITEIRKDSKTVVRIDGLVFHSSLAVQRIEIQKRDEAAVIYVFLVPAKKGLSGSFTTEVPIQGDVQRILFGKSEVQIWPKQ
jgi:hypothetical protein